MSKTLKNTIYFSITLAMLFVLQSHLFAFWMPTPLKDLVKEASFIIKVKIIESKTIEAESAGETKGYINCEARVKVLEVLKGIDALKGKSEIKVSFKRNVATVITQKDGSELYIEPLICPSPIDLNKDETVILFLANEKDGLFNLVQNSEDGKFCYDDNYFWNAKMKKEDSVKPLKDLILLINEKVK